MFSAFLMLVYFNFDVSLTLFTPRRTEIYKQKLRYLNQSLSDEPLVHWYYKEIYKTLDSIKMNEYDVKRSIHVPKKSLFKNVLQKAIKGEDIRVVIIGGSISGGGQNEKDKVYHSVFQNYWNSIFKPLGSTMHIENLALGASTSMWYAYCLENYISSNATIDIVIWEFSANDWFVFKRSPAMYLELFTRRMINLLKEPPLIIHLHLTLGKYQSFFLLYDEIVFEDCVLLPPALERCGARGDDKFDRQKFGVKVIFLTTFFYGVYLSK